jgi:hypothetical protein
VSGVLRALGPYLGWICGAAGVLLCGLGWYGVSGELYPARQIPYLASATAPGVALIVGGLVLLAARTRAAGETPELEQLRLQVAALYGLLTEPMPDDDAGPVQTGTPEPGAVLAAPGGGTYHRPGCSLMDGRQDAQRITPAAAADRGLRPCPLCEPPEG